MPKVEIKKNEVWVGKKNIPLLSGEVHYWRLNPSYWKEVLARVRELGLDMVSTYIPWDYHEHPRGHFDFTGKTDGTRNLKGFLELAHKEGFWVIIRPGPYIYSEWPNGGVPSYAYKYHRLHPKFQAYARNYLTQVLKILKPYFASRRGGHILLLQADNEIDPWPDVFGHQYGLNTKPGLFQDYLKRIYFGQIGDLNESWGTHYRSFGEAGPFIATMFKDESGLALKGDQELRRNLDYLRFKYFYSAECAEWNVRTFRELGVDIPIYLNLYPFFYAHDWAQMQTAADFIGIDLYPANEFSEDEFEHRKFIDKIRYLKSISKVPFIPEFESGIWHARHYESGVLTPNHYRLMALSALLGGAAGWNWYMLVNRDNWYMSPINEWGRVHEELYGVFRQLVQVFREMDPPRLQKLAEIAVTFNPMQYAARTFTHNSSILVDLYQADVDYELYDPRFGLCPKKFLFYSGNQWLEASSQRNLRRYVEEGGTLIAFREYPRKDESFRPSSIIGFEEPRRTLFEFKRTFTIQLAPGRPKIELTSSVYDFDEKLKGQKITADFGPFGRGVVGYLKKIGKGYLLHLGLEPSRELILEILNFFKVPLGSYSNMREIKTALFRRGQHYFLVAVNNGDESKNADVYLPALAHCGGRVKMRDLINQKEKVFAFTKRSPCTIEIPRKDGRVYEFRPYQGRQ